MAGSSAEITWVSNEAAIIRSHEKIERVMDNLVRKMDKVERASVKAAQGAGREFDQATTSLRNFAMGIAGVGGVIAGVQLTARTLKAEWEEMQARQKAAAMSQMGAGAALREMRKAFGPDQGLGWADVDQRVTNLALGAGSTVPIGAAVAQTAFSAKGQLSNTAALSAIETALRVAPQDAGEATTLAGRYLDVMKFSGVQDARAVAGFLQQVQQSSRITNMASVGQNLVPAIGSLTKLGDSPEQAAEVAAALNQMMADEEGAMTRTAVIQLGNQLKDFLPDLPNTQARITALQNDPAQRAKFLKKASFEQASKNFIFSMLAGDAGALADLAAAQGNIPALDMAMAPVFEEQLRNIQGGEFQPLVGGAQAAAAATERFRLGQTREGRIARAREILTESLGAVDFIGPDLPVRAGRQFSFETAMLGGGIDPEYAASMILQGVANDRRLLGRNETDAQSREYLRQQADVLNKILDEVRKQNNGDAPPQKVEVINNGGQRALPSAQLRR